jgi:hypothetical protein
MRTMRSTQLGSCRFADINLCVMQSGRNRDGCLLNSDVPAFSSFTETLMTCPTAKTGKHGRLRLEC